MGHCKISLSLPMLLISFLSICSVAPADDGAVMEKLKAAISPTPTKWTTAGNNGYCSWSDVLCDSNRVISINLASRSLSGILPSDLNSLTQLTSLSLQSNFFSGALPSFANLSFLQTLYLDNNRFTSIPPACFQGLTSLQTLSLGDNNDLAPWTIPTDLAQSSSLVNFYAGNSSLFGSLPDFFDSFDSLQNFRVSSNNITGSLPPSLGRSHIRNLWLNNQLLGFSGSIGALSTMTQLYQAWLQNNKFTGEIPDLSKCENLFDLQLRHNLLVGIVPQSLMQISSLRNVSLANNKLQGPLPVFGSGVTADKAGTNSFCLETPGPCDSQVTALLEVAGALGYPLSLANSWEGNNACKEWTFIMCTNGSVTTVNMGKQHFGGTISPAFANITSLKNLYLGENNLTGSIPESLTTLSVLQVMDVSNNNLSGIVPKFSSTVKLSTAGNPLIGITLSPSSGGDGSGSNDTTSGSSSSGSSNSSVSSGIIAGVVIPVVIFIVVLVFVFCKCYRNRQRKLFRKPENPENGKETTQNEVVGGGNGYVRALPSELHSRTSGDPSDLHLFEGGNVAISIQVLRQVTNNFSKDNILGRGGFGVVYKGELHDGTKIAVKRMESMAVGTKGMNEFQAEIAVLTKVRHRHLVALLGYCINGRERLLVYEYMPQGTLTQHLFDWRKNGNSALTWKQRVTIALDVGRGVEYLHSLAQQSFIHRDLKPSNILLGDDMRAKVADFGLVKHAPDGKYSVETRVAGTLGYLAPEYAATGRVTTKADVYAFGLVLMELITGRRALDDTMSEERSHLVTWFRRVLINKDNIRKSIDETLNPDRQTMESIYKVAELAGYCTAQEPYQRPDMGHAVNILGPLVEQWKPSLLEEESYGIDLHMSLPQPLQRWQANEATSTMFNGNSYSQISVNQAAEEKDESKTKKNKQNEASGNEKDASKAKAEPTADMKDEQDGHQKQTKENSKPPEPPKDCIHVRARRGQATDSVTV